MGEAPSFACLDCEAVVLMKPRRSDGDRNTSRPLRCESCRKERNHRRVNDGYRRRLGREIRPRFWAWSRADCTRCGQPVKRLDATFCGRECARPIARTPQAVAGTAIPPAVRYTPRTCAICGASFLRNRRRAKYCGRRCADLGRVARVAVVRCQLCGTESLRSLGGNHALYCSRACTQEAARIRVRAIGDSSLRIEEVPSDYLAAVTLRRELNRNLWRVRNGL